MLALKWLRPYVRPAPNRPEQATDLEKLEYAFALSKIGAFEESKNLNAEIDPQKNTRCYLARSAAWVGIWEYEQSIGPLTAYLKVGDPASYEYLVAQVNLLAAYSYLREIEDGLALFEDLRESTMSFPLLQGKVFEIGAQFSIQKGDTESARTQLSKAKDLLGGMKSLDVFLVEKWEALLLLCEKGPTTSVKAELNRVRTRAKELRHWETVRQVDRYWAIAKEDEALFLHIYFGTPFASFRQWIKKDAWKDISIPATFDLHLSDLPPSDAPLNAKTGPFLDLLVGKEQSEHTFLKLGSMTQRMLRALSGDFYRPLSFGMLHEALYPDQFFDPSSSPDKLHQVKRQLRKQLVDADFPLAIEERFGFYHLEHTSPCTLRVPSPESNTEYPQLALLFAEFKKNSFSVPEAAKVLNLSEASALRLLNEVKNKGLVSREGKARRTRYQIKTAA